MNGSLSLLTLALLAATAYAQEYPTPHGLASDAVTETIRQRDATGRIRVAREVAQNEAGDYVNHGTWRSWNVDGELIGQGRYVSGEPTGSWSRWATAEESPLLATAPFAGFTGPFLSQANYRDGKLEGKWSIFAADGRLISEIAFRNGQRHGEAVLMSATGSLYRRSHFEEGLPVGTLQQQSSAGQLETIATFIDGRRQVERVERYASGAPESRENWLGPLTTAVSPDDPWRLRFAHFEATGDELRHGYREAWWPNGQLKLRAEYERGEAIAQARWWHENGLLALKGSYEEGVADGQWSWWRENGVRAAQCRYTAGKPSEWEMWTADGRGKPASDLEQLASGAASEPGSTSRH